MDAEQVVGLERDGWRALSDGTAAEFYDAAMTDDAMMALPSGLLDRKSCIEAMAAAPPWSTHELWDFRVVALSETSAMVVYHAEAQREGQPPYRAIMGTVYVLKHDGWRLTFHQQTPLMDG
jgi:hypothetical protein